MQCLISRVSSSSSSHPSVLERTFLSSLTGIVSSSCTSATERKREPMFAFFFSQAFPPPSWTWRCPPPSRILSHQKPLTRSPVLYQDQDDQVFFGFAFKDPSLQPLLQLIIFSWTQLTFICQQTFTVSFHGKTSWFIIFNSALSVYSKPHRPFLPFSIFAFRKVQVLPSTIRSI